MSDKRSAQGAVQGPQEMLRLGADELEQRALMLLEQVGQNSESAYLLEFVNDMRAGADEIERLRLMLDAVDEWGFNINTALRAAEKYGASKFDALSGVTYDRRR